MLFTTTGTLLDAEVIGLREAGGVVGLLDDVNVRHAAVEHDVGHDTILLRDAGEVVQELLTGGLRPVVRWRRVRGVILEVVDREFRLQLRSLVPVHHPGSAANNMVSVEDHKVCEPLLEKAQRSPEASVASSNNSVGMAPPHFFALEALCALYQGVRPNLLLVTQCTRFATNTRLNEGEGLPVAGKFSCKHVPHLDHLRRHLEWQRQGLIGT
mmetsp:Transcript_1244/g.2956  ORF Transcript_1244/g.2956 Transcript_1244/m.2956 type:complete len:212 (+) Transcript_1244:999-1634(+)